MHQEVLAALKQALGVTHPDTLRSPGPSASRGLGFRVEGSVGFCFSV